MPTQPELVRDFLKTNVLGIWFGAFVGALASRLLENTTDTCMSPNPFPSWQWWVSWVPPQDCQAYMTFVAFPISLAMVLIIMIGIIILLMPIATWLVAITNR